MTTPLHHNRQAPLNTIRSKHRLADISHHFLSNSDDRLPAWENTTVIPVLLGSKNDDYVVYELNRAFNQQNSSSMVLNIENRLSSKNQLPGLAKDATSQSENEDSNLPDYCLIPAASPSTTLALRSERIIIAVHASLSGVRVAYDQLAFMASLNTELKVCAIILDAKDKPSAQRFFGFLCNNAQSLLSLKLECGGYLLQNGERYAGDHAEYFETTDEDMITGMKAVAKNLLTQFSPHKKTKATIAQLGAPHDTSLLLS